MNTAFTRLVWKESRAQRTLWTLLLLGAFVLYVLIRLQSGLWLGSLAATSVFGILFVAASLAIAFAGEVDDGTVGLLRMLPCRTSVLISAKLTAILAGCVALAAAMCVLSAGFELLAQLFPTLWRTETSTHPRDYEVLWSFAGTILLIGSASFFASLSSRKVISSVTIASIIVMLVVFAIMYLKSTNQAGELAAWFGGASLIFFVFSTAVLARPWHLGKLPRQSSMVKPAASRFADRPSLSFVWIWIPLLQRITAQPLSLRRILSTLAWRECRSAIPFALKWLAIGVVLCAGRSFIFSEYPFPFMFLLVFIHECGQRTMRDDQRSGAISLLANIGTSPIHVWLTKTACWFGVMTAVVVSIAAMDTIVPSYNIERLHAAKELRVGQILSLVRVPDLSNRAASDLIGIPSSPEDRWLQLEVCLAVVPGLFSIGQLTACWIRRQILAFAASFLLASLVSVVFVRFVASDLPIWIAFVPMSFCLLFATACTARSWIDRTITWRFRIRQTVWMVFSFTVFPLLSWYWWTCQPSVALARSGGTPTVGAASYDSAEPVASEQVTKLTQMQMLPSAEWGQLDSPSEANCWYDFAAVLDRFPLHRMLISTNHYVGDSTTIDSQHPLLLSRWEFLERGPAVLRPLLQPFDAALASGNKWPTLPISWTAPWSGTPAAALTAILLEDARHRENSGDITGAVQQIVRAIHLNRSLSMQTASWSNWLVCLDAERVALGRLRLLLGTADLSATDLDRVFSELMAALMFTQQRGSVAYQVHSPQLMLRRRTLFWAAVAAEGSSVFEKLLSLPAPSRGFEVTETDLKSWRAEIDSYSSDGLERAVDVMTYSESLLKEHYRTLHFLGRVHFYTYDGEAEQHRISQVRQLSGFVATSELGDVGTDIIVLGSDNIPNHVLCMHVDTIACERATVLTVILQRHRVVHGTFPRSLLNLPDANLFHTLMQQDPWTGAPFLYVPDGTDLPIRLGYNRKELRATSGQPLLFSLGSWGLGINVLLNSGGGEEAEPAEIYQLPPNLILFVGLNDPVDWRLRQIATSVTMSKYSPTGSQNPASATQSAGQMGTTQSMPDHPDDTTPQLPNQIR